eukprot:12662392-Prorocentrum_lima.AAC.1
MAIGQTTNEAVRGVFDFRTNPHDHGCMNNISSVLQTRIPPSGLADMSELVTVQGSAQVTTTRSSVDATGA